MTNPLENIAEEPGISVRVAAIMPPVQDSAQQTRWPLCPNLDKSFFAKKDGLSKFEFPPVI